jgi:hypothetical protein
MRQNPLGGPCLAVSYSAVWPPFFRKISPTLSENEQQLQIMQRAMIFSHLHKKLRCTI